MVNVYFFSVSKSIVKITCRISSYTLITISLITIFMYLEIYRSGGIGQIFWKNDLCFVRLLMIMIHHTNTFPLIAIIRLQYSVKRLSALLRDAHHSWQRARFYFTIVIKATLTYGLQICAFSNGKSDVSRKRGKPQYEHTRLDSSSELT